jgi:xanthine dehydrogenase accessory factor
MSLLRPIVAELHEAANRGDRVVLASVVRVVGSSYGGVGARMLVRVDGATVGLVSGGCLESDLASHALRVHRTGEPAVVTYDTRADDDAVWGLGLGCNGLIDVLLEPLDPAAARETAGLLHAALSGASPAVIATVADAGDDAAPRLGARALLAGAVPPGDDACDLTTGGWGNGAALREVRELRVAALAAGRRGFVQECAGVVVAFETVHPMVRLLVCGSGPDVMPVSRFAVQMGWDVTVVDHRPVAHARPERFPGAAVVECADPLRLGESVALHPATCAVVMSHHFARDTDYVQSLLTSEVRYVGVLGPRSRTERILAELASRGAAPHDATDRLHGPVGLDLGGEGPDAIALAIVAEVSAVAHARSGEPRRDVVAADRTGT